MSASHNVTSPFPSVTPEHANSQIHVHMHVHTHTHTEKWFCLCVCPYPLSRMKEPCEKSLVVISGKCGSPVFSQ